MRQLEPIVRVHRLGAQHPVETGQESGEEHVAIQHLGHAVGCAEHLNVEAGQRRLPTKLPEGDLVARIHAAFIPVAHRVVQATHPVALRQRLEEPAGLIGGEEAGLAVTLEEAEVEALR